MYKIFRTHGQTLFAIGTAILLMLLLTGSPALNAQTKPMPPDLIDRVKKQVKQFALTTRSISCRFKQEKEMSMIAEKINSGGTFHFKKEKMLRWEYTEPYSYIIVIRNDRISIRDEGDVSHFSISSNQVFLEINRIIMGSVQGTLFDDEKNFRSSFFESPTAYIVRLQPKNARLRNSLLEIAIYFNTRDFSVDRLEMTESGGDKTRIQFSEKVFNKPVGDEKFVVD